MANVPITSEEAAARAGVRLRATEPSDMAAVTEMLNQPSVYAGTMQVPFASVAMREARFQASSDVHSIVAVSLHDETVLAGNASLHRNMRPRRIHSGSIGMSVRDEWQGRGVGTALLAALCELADDWLQIRRIQLEVYTDNEPAVRLYRRFGFEVEGTLRSDAFRGGAYVDSFTMARLHPDLVR